MTSTFMGLLFKLLSSAKQTMHAVSLLFCKIDANSLQAATSCIWFDIWWRRTPAVLVLSWWRAELLRKVLLGLIPSIDKTFKIVLYELVLHLAGLLQRRTNDVFLTVLMTWSIGGDDLTRQLVP